MNIQQIFVFLLLILFVQTPSLAQDVASPDQGQVLTPLFAEQAVLPLKMSYSNKDMKKKTNDSTYIKSAFSYQAPDGTWKSLDVDLRARGNFRRENCYFPPIKMKLDKAVTDGTYFEGHKKLKLVLPCNQQKATNDYVVKEYMAYKIYEIISPYHFKTRLVNVDFTEDKGKKTATHALKGILVEDQKVLAERYNGKVLKRTVHPLQQDAVSSVQNCFFQCFISNTDYSTAYQHNEKLFFIDKVTIPVPYDFDMSGLVDASYSVVSQVQGEVLEITSVTQRMYRGFKRDEQILQQVRRHFIDNKDAIMAVVDSLEPEFEDPKNFQKARNFLMEFFPILVNDLAFKREILDKARTK